MAQTQNSPRVATNEARAVARTLPSSPRKLNLLAQLIRGKSAAGALSALMFSKRRMAEDVKKVVESAIANAENNHNLNIDRLIVAEAYVGKTVKMRRFKASAKGRAAPREKFMSNITVVLREVDAVAPKAAKAAKPTVKNDVNPTAKAASKADAAKAAPKVKKAAEVATNSIEENA